MDWNTLIYNNINKTTNDCYDIFISKITNVYEQCFPLTKISRRAYKDKRWFSMGLKNSARQKNKLYKIYLSTKNPSDEKRYKVYCKLFKKVSARAEKIYYDKQFDVNANSTKQIWTNLNRVCSVKKKFKSKCTIDNINVGGKSCANPKLISASSNNYFSNIGETLVDKLPTVAVNYTAYMSKLVSNSFFCDPLECQKLLYLIDDLKCDKACGDHGFGSQIIKDNKFILCEPLTFIYNMSISNGIVPDKLKIAKVIPIF